MKIHLDRGEGRNAIQRYAAGEIVINERTYRGSLVVTARELIENWPPIGAADLTVEHLEPILGLDPEVVLFGTGARLEFPDPGLFAGLMARRIGYEVMDTGAACRTFNILMSEGRRVVAALMVIRP